VLVVGAQERAAVLALLLGLLHAPGRGRCSHFRGHFRAPLQAPSAILAKPMRDSPHEAKMGGGGGGHATPPAATRAKAAACCRSPRSPARASRAPGILSDPRNGFHREFVYRICPQGPETGSGGLGLRGGPLASQPRSPIVASASTGRVCPVIVTYGALGCSAPLSRKRLAFSMQAPKKWCRELQTHRSYGWCGHFPAGRPFS
jgi:hypothetical protein